jgi:hypothetical protein
MTAARITPRDRAALWLIVVYVACAFTLELYWLVYHGSLPGRSDLFARAFAFYGRGDPGYYDRISSFEIGLESFHLVLTQWLLICLAAGIWRRATWRYPLQLAVGSYVCYSTALYLLAKHVSGYPDMPGYDMPSHNLASFLILYLPNLPWLFGNAWLAWDAARAITRAFRRVAANT